MEYTTTVKWTTDIKKLLGGWYTCLVRYTLPKSSTDDTPYPIGTVYVMTLYWSPSNGNGYWTEVELGDREEALDPKYYRVLAVAETRPPHDRVKVEELCDVSNRENYGIYKRDYELNDGIDWDEVERTFNALGYDTKAGLDEFKPVEK